MEVYATPAANALHVSNECPMPDFVMMIEMMSLLVAATLMVHVLYPSAVRRAAEWKIVIKEVQTTNDVVHMEVAMVEDAVSSDVVTLLEVPAMKAAVAEVTTPKTETPLTAGAPLVIAVLLDSELIKGI